MSLKSQNKIFVDNIKCLEIIEDVWNGKLLVDSKVLIVKI